MKILVDYPNPGDEASVVESSLVPAAEVAERLDAADLLRYPRARARRVRGPRGDRLRRGARRRHPPPGPPRARGDCPAARLRREPARADRARAGRPLAGDAARPRPRAHQRHPRPRPGGAAPPARAVLRGPERGRGRGRPARARCSRPCPSRTSGGRDGRSRRERRARASRGPAGSGPRAGRPRGGARPRLRAAHGRPARGRAPGDGRGVGHRARAAAPLPAGRRRTPARPGRPRPARASRTCASRCPSGCSPPGCSWTSPRRWPSGPPIGSRATWPRAWSTCSARLAVKRGGRVGLLTFGAPETRLLPPRGGRGALVALQRALAEGVAPDGSAGEPLEDALLRTGRLTRMSSLIVVVSDFTGPERWARRLAALAARHTLLAVEVRDPREEGLPAVGRLAMVDPETGQRVEVDTSSRSLRERYAAAAAERHARDRGGAAAGGHRARGPVHRAASGLASSGGSSRELRRARLPRRARGDPAGAAGLCRGPAPLAPLRRPLHRRRHARAARAAGLALAARRAARAVPRGARRAGARAGAPAGDRRRAARAGDRRARHGRVALDAGRRRRAEPPRRVPRRGPDASSTSCPTRRSSGSWRSPRSRTRSSRPARTATEIEETIDSLAADGGTGTGEALAAALRLVDGRGERKRAGGDGAALGRQGHDRARPAAGGAPAPAGSGSRSTRSRSAPRAP